MNLISTNFSGLYIIEPKVFNDRRGYFFESYNQQIFSEHGIETKFVQDNESSSMYGVIRGLHFQHPPHAQTKLIRVVEGAIYDVVIDLRKSSPTFTRWMGIELSAVNKRQFYIPKGFAHGFSVLSEQAVIQYKCDDFYHPQSECGILYNDPQLAIDFQVDASQTIVSEKDKHLPALNEVIKNVIFE